MLPVLLFNNMEGSSNSINNNANHAFGQLYDDNVILNSVRSRKKVSETASCPVCSCTIRQGELDSHLNLELDRLHKLSNSGSKRKLSVNSSSNTSLNPVPGSSTEEIPDDQEVDVSGCPGSDVYQRVHSNRLRRLRARRRGSPPPATGECPVCNISMPTSRLQRHALRCLKRTGASMDEDVPDSSSDESIDVENDSPGGFGAEYQWGGEWRVRASALQPADARAATCVRRASHDQALNDSPGGFGAEYQWGGEWRVRASALQPADARAATCVRRASHDQALVVDGDEDTELYGPPQYSPSRIAVDAETTPADRPFDDQPTVENGVADQVVSDMHTSFTEPEPIKENKPNGECLVEASAETRIQALKERIRDLESKQNGASDAKCLICLGSYTSPAVSIQCWHVYCEVCWLESLKAKKICPQCNAITTAQHLRRIYM